LQQQQQNAHGAGGDGDRPPGWHVMQGLHVIVMGMEGVMGMWLQYVPYHFQQQCTVSISILTTR
jgi:hypothetical protein